MNKTEILNYKYFYSSNDFVKWQQDNPNIMLTQVIPVLDEIRGTTENDVILEECKNKIFVLYFKMNGESVE